MKILHCGPKHTHKITTKLISDQKSSDVVVKIDGETPTDEKEKSQEEYATNTPRRNKHHLIVKHHVPG